uniref:Uncharacterized protein n=1 Tax=Molossus molossus TaxID=27622 RepID=A0A7J8J0G2_MOLMO|nr:hypothetical protein HJG59_010296 [Molossus molossus]
MPFDQTSSPDSFLSATEALPASMEQRDRTGRPERWPRWPRNLRRASWLGPSLPHAGWSPAASCTLCRRPSREPAEHTGKEAEGSEGEALGTATAEAVFKYCQVSTGLRNDKTGLYSKHRAAQLSFPASQGPAPPESETEGSRRIRPVPLDPELLSNYLWEVLEPTSSINSSLLTAWLWPSPTLGIFYLKNISRYVYE